MKNFTLISFFVLILTLSLKAQDPTTVNFTILENPLTEGTLPQTASGQEIWGDYNNDGLLDIFIIAGQGSPFSALYKNNGDGTFTEVLTEVTMMAISSAMFFDYDNDGNLDLIIAGSVDGTATAVLTELYHNSGAPDYELFLNEEEEFVGISAESGDNNTRLIEVVDYNNDGWQDVFLCGNAGGEWEVTQNARVVALYKNNQGTFELQTTPVDGTDNFVAMNGGGIHCGDINNDGFADMIVSGYVDGDIQTVTDLYINNGDGTFSAFADSRTLFTGHTQGETVFADINNDGWLDIVEFGRDVNNGWANFANLFINNQDETFTKIESTTTNLIGGGASVAVGDLNNDGYVDLAASGWGPNMSFFYNKGDSTFLVTAIEPDIARARAGCINFVDFNKDNNLDFTIFGYRDGGEGTTENPTWPDFLLTNDLNDGISNNEAPAEPENITVSADGDNVTVSWDAATDDNTPAEAIRYNVYAKSKTGSDIYTYFPADITSGMLKASGVRPFISGTSITFTGLSTDGYTFGVQAIDNANLASEFTSEPSTGIISKSIDLENISVYGYDHFIKIKNIANNSITYKVFSLTGKEIIGGNCVSNETVEIPMSLTGIYLVQISNGNSLKTHKAIIY